MLRVPPPADWSFSGTPLEFESRLEPDRPIAPITHQTRNDRQNEFRITFFGGLEYYKTPPIFSKTFHIFALI
jgi:hypothetical protein